jgi:hypothetical protein
LDGTGLASHSGAVATMLLLHTILTKSSICGMQINKNQPQPGKEYRYLDDEGEIQRWCDVHPLIRGIQEFNEALVRGDIRNKGGV